MPRIDLTTAGIKVGYGVETVAGTKPAKFTWIQGAKSLPEVNPEPEALETTTLDEINFKTYVDGLKDVGGALSITFGLTSTLKTAWEALMAAYKTAKAAGFSIWIEFYIPNYDDAFYFCGNPSELGFGGAEVGAVLEIPTYITPTKVTGWDEPVEPTVAA